jgi:hypothetical protein
MARIKHVLNERRLAYQGVSDLVEEQQEHDEDVEVLRYLNNVRSEALEMNSKPPPSPLPNTASQELNNTEASVTSDATSSEPIGEPIAQNSSVVRETVQQAA